jgi:hypothetical protein
LFTRIINGSNQLDLYKYYLLPNGHENKHRAGKDVENDMILGKEPFMTRFIYLYKPPLIDKLNMDQSNSFKNCFTIIDYST